MCVWGHAFWRLVDIYLDYKVYVVRVRACMCACDVWRGIDTYLNYTVSVVCVCACVRVVSSTEHVQRVSTSVDAEGGSIYCFNSSVVLLYN